MVKKSGPVPCTLCERSFTSIPNMKQVSGISTYPRRFADSSPQHVRDKHGDTPTPAPPVQDHTPVRPAQGKPPVQPTQGKPPVQPAQGKPPVRPVQGQPPVQHVQGQPPVKPAQGQLPVRPVQGKPPVQPVRTPFFGQTRSAKPRVSPPLRPPVRYAENATRLSLPQKPSNEFGIPHLSLSNVLILEQHKIASHGWKCTKCPALPPFESGTAWQAVRISGLSLSHLLTNSAAFQ